MRKDKISSFYQVKFGAVVITLLPFDKVKEYWLPRGLDHWQYEKLQIVKRDTIIVTDGNVELEVMAGTLESKSFNTGSLTKEKKN